MSLQLNIICGGLILTIDGHHQALDGTGQEQICFLLHKACRSEALTPYEIEMGNKDRSSIVQPLSDAWQPAEDFRYLEKNWQSRVEPAVTTDREPLVWANLAFSGESLQNPKAEAGRS
jgi:hypothetical protein